MEPIIEPIALELLRGELTPDKLLRTTNKANNEIYVLDAHSSPNVMREIGRLREYSFRSAGGGTGLACDIDEYDTMPNPYKQLIVWNPQANEIIGGYRFIHCKYSAINPINRQPHLATAHLFHYSEEFIKDYLPYTLELGRSFVCPEYQSSKAGAKSLYALDNLWDGIGALIVEEPDLKYFSGKVTMYPSENTRCRDLILYYLDHFYGNNNNLITPLERLRYTINQAEVDQLFTAASAKENFKLLSQQVRALGGTIPPLVNAYLGLSDSVKTFGTIINTEFGHVEETGLIVTIADIYPDKRDRHIDSYLLEKKNLILKSPKIDA